MLKELLTIVVICYDPYLDAIKLSSKLLKENFNQCDANVLYVTSKTRINDSFPVKITNGDLSFCKRLLVALENVKTRYILLLLDDYLVDRPINNESILEVLHFLESEHADYCELFTYSIKPRVKRVNNFIMEISCLEKYRIVLQPAIFSKELLLKAAKKEPQTAWDVELNFMDQEFSSVRAFFATNNCIHIINYIDKGYVTRKAWHFLSKKKLWEEQREVMSISKTIKKYFVTRLARFIPEPLKKKIKRERIYKG